MTLELAADAEQLLEAGETLRLVHAQMEHDRGEEHETDHRAYPEALHAGRDQACARRPSDRLAAPLMRVDQHTP